MIKAAIPVIALLLVSACAEKTCAAPRANWAKNEPFDDVLALDKHDRILWNGQITSFERLRDTLNKADAQAHVVRLIPAAGTSCEMIEKVRLAMDRSLSCGQRRCLETAAGQ
ncbi:hypothetical protein [Sphingobium boeckii]|uniref:Uncharacterized protein n=1 Tax=Sphingobium boeckii TaxID=1082345 RepID=A0A7W9AJC7_9SPHN|nr:hypothetical protein [Sphingobium boeckii]MBB5686529.1 hypothetical protein [Sphingobium boeckii]